MEKRDSENEERTTYWAANSPISLPAPTASHEVIQANEQKGFLDLPNEILLKIFSYLPDLDLVLGVRKTCKRLHELSFSSCLWGDVTMKYDKERHGSERTYVSYMMGQLSQTCPVSQYWGGGEDTVPGTGVCSQQWVKDRVSSLSVSCVDGTPVMSDYIVNKPLKFSRLQRLVLKVYSLPNTIFQYQNSGLRSLTIDCVHSKGHVNRVSTLFRHLKTCTSLQTFQLQIEKWEEPLDRVKTMWMPMKDFFQTRPALTRLRLDIPVNDNMFTTILEFCENLQDLQLSNGHLTQKALKKTLKSPNHFLTALKLRGCALTDPRMVYVMAESFRHLKQLEFSMYVSLSLADMYVWSQVRSALLSRKFFPELTVLKLKVESTKALSDIQRSIQQNNNDSAGEAWPSVSCPVVEPIVPEVGKLEELEYSDFSVRNLDITHVCLQPHLRSLVLVTMPPNRPDRPEVSSGFVSVHSMRRLVESCCKLKHVNLRGYRMTATGLAVLRSLPLLETLHCSLYQLQDHLVKPDSPENGEDARESSLRCLELDWHNFTCQNLSTLCSFFPGLTSLTILMCRVKVTLDMTEIIATSLPRLENFHLEQDIFLRLKHGEGILSYLALRHLLTSDLGLRSVTWLVPTIVYRQNLAGIVVHHPTLSRLIWDRTYLHFNVKCPEDFMDYMDIQFNLMTGPSRRITAKWMCTNLQRVYYDDNSIIRLKPRRENVLAHCLCVYRRRKDSKVPHSSEVVDYWPDRLVVVPFVG